MKPRSRSPSPSTSRARLLGLLLCCFCSSVARSQTAESDSCTGTTGGLAAAVSRLIPFDTSNLTCFDAWTSQGFILRVRHHAVTHIFHSAVHAWHVPDPNAGY